MHCGALIVCSGIDCRMHYEWCENLWSSPTARSADRMHSVACMHAHHAAYSMHAHRRLVCNTHGLHSLSLQQLIFKMDARSVQILMENPLGWWRRILRRMNGRNSHTCSCPNTQMQNGKRYSTHVPFGVCIPQSVSTKFNMQLGINLLPSDLCSWSMLCVKPKNSSEFALYVYIIELKKNGHIHLTKGTCAVCRVRHAQNTEVVSSYVNIWYLIRCSIKRIINS